MRSKTSLYQLIGPYEVACVDLYRRPCRPMANYNVWWLYYMGSYNVNGISSFSCPFKQVVSSRYGYNPETYVVIISLVGRWVVGPKSNVLWLENPLEMCVWCVFDMKLHYFVCIKSQGLFGNCSRSWWTYTFFTPGFWNSFDHGCQTVCLLSRNWLNTYNMFWG